MLTFLMQTWRFVVVATQCSGHLIKPTHAVFLAVCMLTSFAAVAQPAAATPGVVIMHGKGGSPNRHVKGLAATLQDQGFLVVNTEMPWSRERDYDVSLEGAEKEVDGAIAQLRAQGAQRIFLAGHSQGGMFALYYASRHPVNGVIALAPGGDPGSATPREKLAPSVAFARIQTANGHGDEEMELADYESAKGTYPVHTTPNIYLSWFAPDSDYNLLRSVKALPAALPLLYIAPTRDYPALVRANQNILAASPRQGKTEVYEPNSTHIGAPSASISKVVEWVRSISVMP
jgi:pimeloyl-ACP methyl ester carboxylesterase